MDHRALEFGAYGRLAAFLSVGVSMLATAARTRWFPMRNSPLEMARVTGEERKYVEWTCRNETNAVCLEHLLDLPGLSNLSNSLPVPPLTYSTNTNSTLMTSSEHAVPNIPLSIAFTISLLVIMAVLVFAMTPLVTPDIRYAWNFTIAKLQRIKYSTPTYCTFVRKATYNNVVNLLKLEKELLANTRTGLVATIKQLAAERTEELLKGETAYEALYQNYEFAETKYEFAKERLITSETAVNKLTITVGNQEDQISRHLAEIEQLKEKIEQLLHIDDSSDSSDDGSDDDGSDEGGEDEGGDEEGGEDEGGNDKGGEDEGGDDEGGDDGLGGAGEDPPANMTGRDDGDGDDNGNGDDDDEDGGGPSGGTGGMAANGDGEKGDGQKDHDQARNGSSSPPPAFNPGHKDRGDNSPPASDVTPKQSTPRSSPSPVPAPDATKLPVVDDPTSTTPPATNTPTAGTLPTAPAPDTPTPPTNSPTPTPATRPAADTPSMTAPHTPRTPTTLTSPKVPVGVEYTPPSPTNTTTNRRMNPGASVFTPFTGSGRPTPVPSPSNQAHHSTSYTPGSNVSQNSGSTPSTPGAPHAPLSRQGSAVSNQSSPDDPCPGPMPPKFAHYGREKNETSKAANKTLLNIELFKQKGKALKLLQDLRDGQGSSAHIQAVNAPLLEAKLNECQLDIWWIKNCLEVHYAHVSVKAGQ